ncbi:hypothetical protein [Streptomyces sp. NPDC004065]|uniref:hypothetical protein n=1 Tax=Streptomyces sp. NPDC004065 TaxID=3364689 RepID=UPI003850EC50
MSAAGLWSPSSPSVVTADVGPVVDCDVLTRQGLHPYALALGVDRGEGGACVRCRTCDGFPCLAAKSDTETCGVRPALTGGRVRLLTGTRVVRLDTDPAGRTVVAQARRGGAGLEPRAGTLVLLGDIRLPGEPQAARLKAVRPRLPRPPLRSMTAHSVEWWVMSEDLSDPLTIAAQAIRVARGGRVLP